MIRIDMLADEFDVWARASGFVCSSAHGSAYYGSAGGARLRVRLVDDGVPLRERYQAGWRQLAELGQAIEDSQCDEGELNGLMGWEGGKL